MSVYGPMSDRTGPDDNARSALLWIRVLRRYVSMFGSEELRFFISFMDRTHGRSWIYETKAKQV